jgi:hypothetical protein
MTVPSIYRSTFGSLPAFKRQLFGTRQLFHNAYYTRIILESRIILEELKKEPLLSRTV